MSDLLRITTAGGHTFEAGFNDDGALEPAVGFDWDAVDQDVDQDVDRGPGVDPEQLISALLAGSTSAAVVGERVLLLGFVLNRPEAPKPTGHLPPGSGFPTGRPASKYPSFARI